MWSQVILSKRLQENRVMFCGNSFLVKIPSLYSVSLLPSLTLPWPHRTTLIVVMAPTSAGCFPWAAHSASVALKEGQGVHLGSYLALWACWLASNSAKWNGWGLGMDYVSFPSVTALIWTSRLCIQQLLQKLFLSYPAIKLDLMSANKLPSSGADGQHGCVRLDAFV